MSCFIHNDKESVASCLKCGKNMCEDCSSVTFHSGKCPTCLLPELKVELLNNQQEKRHSITKGSIIEAVAIIIFICLMVAKLSSTGIIISIVGLLAISCIISLRVVFKVKKLNLTIQDLENKIKKIENALHSGSHTI